MQSKLDKSTGKVMRTKLEKQRIGEDSKIRRKTCFHMIVKENVFKGTDRLCKVIKLAEHAVL